MYFFASDSARSNTYAMYHFSSDVWNWYKLFWLAGEFDRKKRIFSFFTLCYFWPPFDNKNLFAICFRIRLTDDAWVSGPDLAPHGCYNLTKFRQNRIKNKKIFIPRTFFVNKQLTLSFNYLKKYSLNFAQNFWECSFNLAGSESGEKSKGTQFFVYISQLFVYKTRLWT